MVFKKLRTPKSIREPVKTPEMHSHVNRIVVRGTHQKQKQVGAVILTY